MSELEVAHPLRPATALEAPHRGLYLLEAQGRRRVQRAVDAFWNQARGPFLNLGCGDDVRPGWVNADKYATHEGVTAMDMGEPGWPFPNASFGGILANQVFEHLPTDYNEAGLDRVITALCEAARVLRPGGRMIVGVPTGPWTWSNLTHYRGFDTRTLHSVLDPAPHTNDHQGKPGLRLERILHLRTLNLGRAFDTSYHCPKYLNGWDPNVGRKRWLIHLLTKPDPNTASTRCGHPRNAPDGPATKRCLNCGTQTRVTA